MQSCGHCGQTSLDYARFCTTCGAPLGPEAQHTANREEVGHIAYLLAHAARWCADGWISAPTLRRIQQAYEARRDGLLSGRTRLHDSDMQTVAEPVVAAPVWRPAPAPAPAAPPPAPQPVRVTRAQAEPAAPSTPWLSEFLLEHWQKLVAALAAALIFGGLRQLLALNWVGRWAVMLLPLAPGSLAGVFYYFGMREQKSRNIGAFACTCVAIVLGAYTVFSANHQWLSDALGDRGCSLTAVLFSSLLAANTLRATRDLRYLHVVLAGAGAAVLALMQVAAPSPVFAPQPAWMHGCAMVAFAGLLLGLSAFSAPLGDEAPNTMRLWAHLSAGLGVALGVMPSVLLGKPEAALATPLLAAGIMYALAAEFYGNPGMVRIGAGCTAAAVFVALWGAHRIGAYPIGPACAGLGVLWWLAALAPRSLERGIVADAYDLPCNMATIGACGVLALRIALTGALADPAANWVQGSTLACLCSLLLAGVAVRRGMPEVMYGSAAALAIGLGIATDRTLKLGHVLDSPSPAHDLVAFAGIALLIGWAHRREAGDDAPDWGLPWLRAAALAATAGIVAAYFGAHTGRGFWFALAPHVGLACVGAAITRRGVGRWDRWAWAGAAILGLSLVAPFAAQASSLADRHDLGAVWGVALAGMAWVWLGTLHLLIRRRPDEPWRGPLEIGCACCAAGGMAESLSWAPASVVLGVAAACCAALTLLPSASARKWPLGLAYLAVLAAWISALVLQNPHFLPWMVALPLFAAAVLASAARRESASPALWSSAACLPLVAIAGFIGPPNLSSAAWIAVAGPAAAAAGSGAAARWRQSQRLSYVAALAFLAAYVRAATLLLHVSAGWAAMAMLPAFAALETAGRAIRPTDSQDLFRVPFRAAWLIGAAVALCVGCFSAWSMGSDLMAATVGLLTYASLIAVLASTDETPDELVAAMAVVVGAAGFGHAELVHWGAANELAASWGALAMALVSACAYLRVARVSAAFGGIAAAFACGAWFAAMHGLLHVRMDWWGAAMLPMSGALWAASDWVSRRYGADTDALRGPVRAGALAATFAVLLVSVLGSTQWGQHWSMGATVGLLVCGAACALAAVSEPEVSHALGGLSATIGVLGWALALAAPWGGGDRRIAALVVVATSAVHAWAYLRASRTASAYAFLSSVACCGAWFALVAGLLRLNVEWWAAAMLPCLAAAYLLAPRAGADADNAQAQRREAFRGGALSAAIVVLLATLVGGTHQLTTWSLGATVGLLAFGALFALASAAEEAPNHGLATLSVVLGLAGWGACAVGSWATRGGEIASGVAAVCAFASACAYLRAASAGPGYAYLASGAACGGWFALVAGVFHPAAEWWPMAMLPAYVAIHCACDSRLPVGDDAVRGTIRDSVLGLATLSASAALLCGILQPRAEGVVVATLCAHGLAIVAGAMRGDRPGCTAIAAGVLTAAFGYALGLHSGVTVPRWACGMAVASAVWLLTGRAAAAIQRLASHAGALYAAAACVAFIASAAGLVTVQTPGEGAFTVLTLAICGAVALGLYLFQQCEAFVHAGFASFFVAYALMLYDHVHLSAAVLDLYLVPLGLYLIVLGQLAGSRRSDESAAVLWWLGLLTTMTPTFAAFCDTRGTASALFHAALLIAECLGAVAWGIANRIRAYAFCGAGFGFAFAAVMAGGRVADAGSATTALVAGVALLAFVYRVGTRQEEARLWIARVSAEWRRWR